MKQFHRITLAAYIVFLLWLVLFKFSTDPLSVIAHYQSRSINLIPFMGYAYNGQEMLDNLLVFIPLGLLLGTALKRTSIWQIAAYIFIGSIGAEILQFIFAIGTTDITDIITNTLGGILGLVVYRFMRTYIHDEKLDQAIAIGMSGLLILFLFLRFSILQVHY